MDKRKVISILLLGLAAFIWGSAFVAQSVGMDYIGPYTFTAMRSFLGAVALLPVILWMDKGKNNDRSLKEVDRHQEDKIKANNKMLYVGGICCGTAMAIASSLQQIGIKYTTVGKAGFITALYIVIVPILGVFLNKKVRTVVWFSVILALVGLYFITMTDNLTLQKGDYYMLLCAFFYSIHILVIDYFSPIVDGIRMSCIQLFVCGILCSIPMLVMEHPQVSSIIAAGTPILYAGILSSGIAFTLQIVAQKNVNPVIASLICSLESVFAVLCGWIILKENLTLKELFGCVIVFAAIILAQMPERKVERTYKNRKDAI